MSNEDLILVVDDDPEDHLILMEYFKEFNADQRIVFFQNGKEAIEYLEKLDRAIALPRLIILDLNMPILNGSQTLYKIKRDHRLKDIPVIIFSTSENENEKRKCLGFGAVDFLVKPSKYDDGLKMVERFVGYLK
jgi:CheY-like chemotaxis protein